MRFPKFHRGFLLYILLFTAALLFLSACAALSPKRPEDGALYINLNEYPGYIKNGFDPQDLSAAPDFSGGLWRPVAPRTGDRRKPLQIRHTGLPGIQKRIFLSPLGERDREFTLIIPFDINREDQEVLARGSFRPGIFFAALGDNWEIFLNGHLVKSEMHLDAAGQIRSHRSWRSVFFQPDTFLFVPGRNILALRIVGAPNYEATGLFYHEPYYIGDYELIERINDESLSLVLCGVYIFMGLYHLLLFLSRRKERYNLYYCIFLAILGIYLLFRTHTIHHYIPNSAVIFKVEYAGIFMLLPMLAAFLEDLNFKKISLVSKIYGGVCLFLAVSQAALPLVFAEDVLSLLPVVIACGILYVFGGDIVYVFFNSAYTNWKTGENPSLPRVLWASIFKTSQGNILIGALFLFITAIPDLAGFLYSHESTLKYSRYGFFIFTMSTTLILIRRFGYLFARLDYMNSALELSNINLENTVRDRTRELELQTQRAESASRAKSAFLARMSHEIRTPMNAVIGMSELALREEARPDMMTEYLNDIKQAGINLLAIINDILDFSKIEAGNLEITPVSYTLSALLNDVINLVRVRITEKGLIFMVHADASLPNNLIGDEVRVRQILLNLLSNAAKYTHQGYVKLSLSGSRVKEGFLLCFEVADSGIGIRAEDRGQLFGDFVRVDPERNKAIEGTGLGLAITRNLCRLMGGDVSVSSEYGKGSVFTARIIQSCLDERKLAAVEKAAAKGSLLFCENPVYAESVRLTLINLHVPVTVCTRGESFFPELETGRYAYAFVSGSAAAEAAALVKARSLKTTVVFLEDFGKTGGAGDLIRLPMPVYAVPAANILNGIVLSERRTSSRVRFLAPRARILLVDDIPTNLKVAEGLLQLYQIKVDTAESGPESLALVQRRDYDLVFMDHMMPGMDGVEAVRLIRALGGRFRELPVIALTANVVSGMEEMFLANGFNDCLSKPIEMSRLDDILRVWIPAEKRDPASGEARPPEPPSAAALEPRDTAAAARPAEDTQPRGEAVRPGEDTQPGGEAARPTEDTQPREEAAGPAPGLFIQGLDVDRGISMTGGSEEIYREVLDLYRQDVEQRLDVFRQTPDAEGLALFTIQAHALKSASASIGAAALSEEAALLEGAGKRGDMAYIEEHLVHFREALSAVAEGIRRAF